MRMGVRPGVCCIAVVLLLISVLGCADRTQIHTDPSGASVFVRDRLFCVTPCLYSSPRSQFTTNTPIRIEKDGYQPVQTTLQTFVSPGRIVGGVFTLGLAPLFKRPHTYISRHDFRLYPSASSTGQPASSRTLESPVPLSSESTAVRSRLAELQGLYEKGLVSRQEYDRARARALRGL